jgi:Zn-dependent protease with chaperone function
VEITLSDFAIALLILWSSWVLFNLAMIVVAERRSPDDGAYIVGFWRPRVFVSPAFAAALTIEELLAIVFHEYGHAVHGHVRENLLKLLILFSRTSEERRAEQELEADAFVVRWGLGLALASALRKLSADPADIRRARYLEVEIETPA